MHVQSNGGWLGGWLALAGWPAENPPPTPPPPMVGAAPWDGSTTTWIATTS